MSASILPAALRRATTVLLLCEIFAQVTPVRAAEPTLQETVDYIRDIVENSCTPQTLRLKSFKYRTVVFDFFVPGVTGTAQVSIQLDRIKSSDVSAFDYKKLHLWRVALTGNPEPMTLAYGDMENGGAKAFSGFPAFIPTKEMAERLGRAFDRAASLAKLAAPDPFAP